MSVKKAISGPYRATKLWNDAVRSFYNGMPVSRHWRGLRQYERCFTASEAIDWLHSHLQRDPNFGKSVSREQTLKLLRKFRKSGLIEDVRGNCTKPEEFRDNRELYRFCNRSPLKALRTPRTPGRSVLTAHNSNKQNGELDAGASPVLKRRFHGSIREKSHTNGELERGGSVLTKVRAKRSASHHAGQNAINEVKDSGGMQECHLVAKQFSEAEVNDVWKQVLLSKLDTLCERLLLGEISTVLEVNVANGSWIHHNMTQVTSRGVVRVSEGHPEDLPNWILTAMKCMAHWPNAVDSSCNIPNYPGVEKDVFKIVRDFFTNLVVPLIPYELYEAFVRFYIGAEFLDISYRSPNSSGEGSFKLESRDGSYEGAELGAGDSVEDLILNMSICSQQKTSTPNIDNENNINGERVGTGGGSTFIRQGSSRSIRSGLHTPSVMRNAHLNSSKLQSLKLSRLKNYTDFKEDNLYPTLLEGSHEDSALETRLENEENIRPVSRQSRISQDHATVRHPETVRSVKTNDQARRNKRENFSNDTAIESSGNIQSKDINTYTLPQNCCFETAFTSDSPKTRIIPQKSVDSLHFKQRGLFRWSPKERPKSIAVSSLMMTDPKPLSGTLCDTTKEYRNVSTVSDLFRSSINVSTNTTGDYVTASIHSPMNRSRSAGNLEILTDGSGACASVKSVDAANIISPNDNPHQRSLASRIRDSIKRKNVRDDLWPRRRNARHRDMKDNRNEVGSDVVQRLRTDSGGYMNLGHVSGTLNQDDAKSIKSCIYEYQDPSSGLNHLRTKSGGFLNLALVPSSDSVDCSSGAYTGPPTARSDSAVLDHFSNSLSPLHDKTRSQEMLTVPHTDLIRRRMVTPDGCLSHSISSSSGCSIYHSAVSHCSRNSTPDLQGPPLPPRPVRPVSRTSKSPVVDPEPDYQNVGNVSKHLSSSANELSDCWVDRTPYGQVPPYAQGGVWRHYHSSPSKRLISRKKGLESYYGSKACLPGLLTKEGKDAAVNSIQLLLLLLTPIRRRKLHLLLRMMSKMAGNDKLSLDEEQSTRALVLNTFTRSILLCDQEADYDELLSLRIISFLMDNHEEVLRPPQDLSVLVHRKLMQMQRNQTKIVYESTVGDRGVTLTYCRQVSEAQYERQRMTGSQQFLCQLLDQIVDNEKLTAKEKKKKLKEFKSLYPDIYKAQFPEEQKVESRSRMKNLIKFASFTSLGKNRNLRI